MSTDYIHHYTDINTLALILKTQNIRFSRLDRVDDLTESDSFEELKLGNFFYVSCWTIEQKESIPQWNMYTNKMAGVRITLPREIFKYKPIEIPNDFIKHIGKTKSPIPLKKLYTDKYTIMPNIFTKKQFEKIVEYDKNFKERKNEAIKIDKSKNKINLKDPTRIAALKSPDWSFQREIRFVLFIVPSVPLPEDGQLDQQHSEKIALKAVKSLQKGIGPDLDYFDLQIDTEILNNIEITTGPLCNDGDKLIVNALIENSTTNGKVLHSKLEGTIRRF